VHEPADRAAHNDPAGIGSARGGFAGQQGPADMRMSACATVQHARLNHHAGLRTSGHVRSMSLSLRRREIWRAPATRIRAPAAVALHAIRGRGPFRMTLAQRG